MSYRLRKFNLQTGITVEYSMCCKYVLIASCHISRMFTQMHFSKSALIETSLHTGNIRSAFNNVFVFLSPPPPQCCRLCWYQGTASSTPSTRCCLASAILYSRMSRTCPRMPPSQSPLLRPTQCPSHTRRGTATQTRREAAAVLPSLIHHPAPTRAVHSKCQVRSIKNLKHLALIFFSFKLNNNSLLFVLLPFLMQRLPHLPTCPQRSK